MRRAARRRGQRVVGDRRIDAGLARPSSDSRRATAASTSGDERRGAGPAAQARAHLGAPEPALVGGGLGLVEIAGGQLHGLDADAIELVRVILERQREQLEHVRRAPGAWRAARPGPPSAPPRARRRRLARGAGSPAASESAAAAAAGEPLGARGQIASGRAPAARAATPSLRLGVDDRDAARPGVLEQPPRVLAQRLEHPFAPLRGPELRQRGRIHRLAVGDRRRPGRHLEQPELGAQVVDDVLADGRDDLGPVEQAPRVDLARRGW